MNSNISRRDAVAFLTASSVVPPTLPMPNSPIDARLIELGHEFHVLVREVFGNSSPASASATEELFERLERVEAEILSTQARSSAGYLVKARAACWALLGDIDPHNGATTDRRMALSIVRDLIRQYDPDLEKPGALKELIADLEPSRTG